MNFEKLFIDIFTGANYNKLMVKWGYVSVQDVSLIVVGGLSLVTTISGVLLLSNVVSADTNSTTDAINITVPVSCTMSGVTIPHTATLNPDTYSGASGSEYEDGIGKTTLTVFCNDNNGFSIYAIGYTGEQYTGENHTKLIGTNSGSTIATKAYASGDTSSNWSMKLSKIEDSAQSYNPQNLAIQSDTEGTFESWHSVPDAFTKVAQYHADVGSSVTDTILGAKLDVTYAVYASATQTADTYTGKVKYTMVHPYNETPLQPQSTSPGYIGYYSNANNAVGSMTDSSGNPAQRLSTTQKTATLLAPNFSRDGYGFAGWNDQFDYSGNYYGPNEDISFTAGQYTGANPGLSLYAVWVKSEGTLQADATAVCNSLTTAPASGVATMASISALTDERDNQTYAIARLADGNCWIIENLRIESASTTRAGDAELAQGYGKSDTFGNFVGLASSENPWDTTNIVSNDLYSTDGSDGTINIGATNALQRIPHYNNANTQSRATSLTSSTTYATTAGANLYGYGNYYDWPAALANVIDYTGPTIEDVNHKTSETVDTSICPNGWRLPYGRNSGKGIEDGGFYKLGTALDATSSNSTSSKIWRKFPTNFVYAGYIYKSEIKSQGVYGYHWASTASNGSNAYLMYEGNTIVSAGTTSISKNNGRTVRCVKIMN